MPFTIFLSAFLLFQIQPLMGKFILPWYGVLRVDVYDPEIPERMHYALQHGRISHGSQFAAEDRRRKPTTYYGEQSGVGLALLNMPRSSGLRVGIVGLGTGTLAAYGRKGDWFTFYEINPAVRDIATTRFTYLSDSPARWDIVLGDARMSLESQRPWNFDILKRKGYKLCNPRTLEP